MDGLTAGDFVAIAAQAKLLAGEWSDDRWLQALRKEHACRPPPARSPGFTT
jgi:hypothetical protein